MIDVGQGEVMIEICMIHSHHAILVRLPAEDIQTRLATVLYFVESTQFIEFCCNNDCPHCYNSQYVYICSTVVIHQQAEVNIQLSTCFNVCMIELFQNWLIVTTQNSAGVV